MTRNIMISLLVPLLLVFSINAKALQGSEAHGFLKSGVLESSVELPSFEVAPDLDHVLIQSATQSSSIAHSLNCFSDTSDRSVATPHTLSCRGPPQSL